MRKLGRMVRRVLTAVSLLLFVAVLAAWVRGYWVVDQVSWLDSESNRYTCATNSGRVELIRDPVFWGHSGHGLDYSTGDPSGVGNVDWQWLGISKSTLGNSFTFDIQVFRVPLIYLAIVFGALPFQRWWVWWRRVRRRRARLTRRCVNCGYDLRASPDRCPECGTAVNQTQGDSAKTSGSGGTV